MDRGMSVGLLTERTVFIDEAAVTSLEVPDVPEDPRSSYYLHAACPPTRKSHHLGKSAAMTSRIRRAKLSQQTARPPGNQQEPTDDDAEKDDIDGAPLNEQDIMGLGLEPGDDLVVPSDEEDHNDYFEEADSYAALVSLVKNMSTAGVPLHLPGKHSESAFLASHSCRNPLSNKSDALKPITI